MSKKADKLIATVCKERFLEIVSEDSLDQSVFDWFVEAVIKLEHEKIAVFSETRNLLDKKHTEWQTEENPCPLSEEFDLLRSEEFDWFDRRYQKLLKKFVKELAKMIERGY